VLGWETIHGELRLSRTERARQRSRTAAVTQVIRGAPDYPNVPLGDDRLLEQASWIGIAVSLALIVIFWADWTSGIIGVVVLGLSIYGAIYQRFAARFRQRLVDRFAEDRLSQIKIINYVAFSLVTLFPRILLPKDYQDSGYRISSYRHGFAAWSRELNDWLIGLTGGEIAFSHDPSQFEPPSALGEGVRQHVELRQVLSGKAFSNDRKIRLATDLVKDGSGNFPAHLCLQRTDYLTGLCTNELSFKQVINSTTRETIYDGLKFFLRSEATGQLIFRGLQASECSNQISTSTIAFTADGYLALVDQTDSNLQSSGLVAPSGSGSLDEADLAASDGRFVAWIEEASKRELREELGIHPDIDMEPGRRDALSALAISSILVGYCVYLFRGGKPEFFFLASIGCSLADLKMRRKYSEAEGTLSKPFVTSEAYRLRAGCDVAAEILRILDELEACEGFRLSCPLEVQIEMLRHLCAGQPDKVRALFARRPGPVPQSKTIPEPQYLAQ